MLTLSLVDCFLRTLLVVVVDNDADVDDDDDVGDAIDGLYDPVPAAF